MAESETEITREELQKEIAEILDNASLENTSTKKVIQKLENKLGVDLTEKKKLIDELVMDYVNSMDSDEESEEEERPKPVPKKKIKKEEEDEDNDDINDDSNDSDWGYYHDGHLLDGYSEDVYHEQPQESTVTTSGTSHHSHNPREVLGVVLKRVPPSCHEEDEADIFGKLTAKKLRKLSDKKRDSMMIQINQLFYDKCHKRKTAPKRHMKHKATSTAPAIQCEAKRIYRLEKTNVAPESPVAAALANLRDTITSTYKHANSDAPPNVPELVVQVGKAHKPIAFSLDVPSPTSKKPENNANTSNKCGVM